MADKKKAKKEEKAFKEKAKVDKRNRDRGDPLDLTWRDRNDAILKNTNRWHNEQQLGDADPDSNMRASYMDQACILAKRINRELSIVDEFAQAWVLRTLKRLAKRGVNLFNTHNVVWGIIPTVTFDCPAAKSEADDEYFNLVNDRGHVAEYRDVTIAWY